MGAAAQHLLARLDCLLRAEHAKFGMAADVTPFFSEPDMEVYPIGHSGVLVFIRDYALCAWEDRDQRRAALDAYWLLGRRLDERGFTRHMVYPLNFRSVKLTRKLGALPDGYDAEGFVHYTLTRERFGRHGQKVATAEGPRPEADHGRTAADCG